MSTEVYKNRAEVMQNLSGDGQNYVSDAKASKGDWDQLPIADQETIRYNMPELVPTEYRNAAPSAPAADQGGRKRRGKKSRVAKTKKGGRRHKKSRSTRRR